MKQTKIIVAFILIAFSLAPANNVLASGEKFDNIELILAEGDNLVEKSVRVEFGETSMRIVGRSNGRLFKEWSYDQISDAEYSYSKKPRWKTGVGLGAASVLFPPLLLIAIPVAFTNHRRHWLTVRTQEDFAVLKVGKGIRKIFMPTFETRTSVQIKAMGQDK
jgi:hypothetical protein